MKTDWRAEARKRKAEAKARAKQIAAFKARLDVVENELRELANLARVDGKLGLRMMPTQRDRLESAHYSVRKFRAGEPLR